MRLASSKKEEDIVLLAGVSSVDITPAPGSPMACFPEAPNRPRRAIGAHDPLKATALVLDDGQTTVAIVACDLTAVHRIDVERIRAHVSSQVSALSGPRVLIAASHTHSSVENCYLFGNTPEDPFVIEMDRRIAGAVLDAFAARQPARLAVGKSRIELNHNRRVIGPDGKASLVPEYQPGVTEGPCDPELYVLRLDGERGDVRAVCFNYTAHALTVGPANRFYTADYPGVARDVVEAAFPGCAALFLNGAAGNVHPRQCMRADFQAMEATGGLLGRAVVETAKNANVLRDASLQLETDTLRFHNRVDPSLEVVVEVSCLRLGTVVMAFVPGEVFVEFQIQFKSELSPAPAIFVGYANGWPGYIPTKEAYTYGGYGVELCTMDPPEFSRTALPKGAGEIILQKCIELAKRLNTATA